MFLTDLMHCMFVRKPSLGPYGVSFAHQINQDKALLTQFLRLSQRDEGGELIWIIGGFADVPERNREF